MRSRFAAYALNLPLYIINTTHPSHPDFLKKQKEWIEEITLFSQTTLFENLIIQQAENNEVLFTAILRQLDKKGRTDISFTELSFFEKTNGRWLYKHGKITPLP